MAFENAVSSDFDPCSSIVKSVFDCLISSVSTEDLIQPNKIWTKHLTFGKIGLKTNFIFT